MKNLTALLTALVLVSIFNCSPKPKESSEFEAASPDSVAPVPESAQYSDQQEETPEKISLIQYDGAANDSLKESLEIFLPLKAILSLSKDAIGSKDIIREKEAYQAILEYQKLVASGVPVQKTKGNILNLTRNVREGDSTSRYLPQIAKSGFLDNENYFILGGAPFIEKIEPVDKKVFTDQHGKPETRFATTVTENNNYLLTSLYQFKSFPATVTFGPPLWSYDGPPQEVNEIGSLIHEFPDRIPVTFLTENGPVAAQLISVTIKLVPENMNCQSDQPYFVFACPQLLGQHEIRAIYIPFKSREINSCSLSHITNDIWIADLNGDKIPELACVSSTFSGISSDTMAESLWFVNVNGEWRIIDWGRDLDCT